MTARSLTRFSVFLGPSLLSLKTKMQKTVAKSSTEAEYKTMSATTLELEWFVNLLQDFHISPQLLSMYCDNKVVTHIAENSVFHERT